MRYSVDKLTGIDLGRQGENLARTVEIDVSAMLTQWPDATISLLVKRKHDADPYVAKTEVREGVLYWPITSADTASAGDGKLELRAVCGEVLAKSATGSTRVTASLTGSETEPPAASQGWVDQVLEAGAGARASAEEAKTAAGRAQSVVETLSALNAKAVTTAAGTQASVEVKDGVITYSIPRGDTGLQGLQGEQGIQGAQGDPGYTPVKGVDYFDGEDGYTPVKGKDYWTAEDQEAIDAAREGEERRSAAEDARAQAERDRTAAEQSRVAAEEQRQTNWQTLRSDVEQRISDAATAAQNANKAETAANGAAEKADVAAQKADDAVSGIEDRFTASERALLDKVCPVFEESGHIVQCHPVEEYPLSVQTRIEAVQEGEGEPSPDNVRPIVGWDSLTVTRCGANLLKITPFNTITKNGITFEYVGGGGIHIHGRATARTDSPAFPLVGWQPGTYIGNKVEHVAPQVVVKRPQDTGYYWMSASVPFTIMDGYKTFYYYFIVSPDKEIDTVFYPQIEVGSVSTPYAPYAGDAFAQALPETVYDGRYDWKAGALTVTSKVFTFTGEEAWTIGGKQSGDVSDYYYQTMAINGAKPENYLVIKSSHYPGASIGWGNTHQGISMSQRCFRIRWGEETPIEDWKAQLAAWHDRGTPLQAIYPLETPQVYQLSPREILTLEGVNTFFSNAGDTMVAGRASPIYLTKEILNRLAALEGAAIAE